MTQKPLNLDGYYFLGIGLDRYFHLFLAFTLCLLFFRFGKLRLGVFVVLILVLLKEVVDLGVIYYYEPIKADKWLDSSIDLLLGFLGVGLAIALQKRILRSKEFSLSKGSSG